MKIGLIAHDNKKAELVAWAQAHSLKLKKHELVATESTGRLLEEKQFLVERLRHGPMGGDQQMGALIAEGKLSALIFFWDPLSSQPHDVDVKALLRLCVVYNIPLACNPSSADLLATRL